MASELKHAAFRSELNAAVAKATLQLEIDTKLRATYYLISNLSLWIKSTKKIAYMDQALNYARRHSGKKTKE